MSLAAVRTALPMIGVGSILLLLTAVIHRGAFNLVLPAAWICLALYLIAPSVYLGLSLRTGLPDTSSRAPPAGATGLRAASIVYGVIGAPLFLWPTLLIPIWPWPLLPLGARTNAAFLFGYALWMWRLSRTSPAELARIPVPYVGIFPLVGLLAPWLHPTALRATTPAGLAYMLLLGATAVASVWVARQLRSQ